MALIELEAVTKAFQLGKETVHALDGVSLTIQEGEFVSIVGPSGSGKSTLMNILGLLDFPSTGVYRLEGTETQTLGDDQAATLRNRKIGFVFQSFLLLPRATALRNVEMPLVYARGSDGRALKRAEMTARASDALARVGLSDRLHHKPNELSGGQRQRVAIARALVNRPKILFADEPTGNLDSRSGQEILTLFEELNLSAAKPEDRTTVILVTHDPQIASRARRIIRVFDGKVTEERSSSDAHS